MRSPVYSSTMAAVKSFQKLGSLKQQNVILSQFWRMEICTPPEALGENPSLAFSAFWQHSLTCGHITPISLPPLRNLSSALKDFQLIRSASLQTSQDNLPKTLNLITPANILCSNMITFISLGHWDLISWWGEHFSTYYT